MILFWYIKNSITHSYPAMKFQDQTMNVNVERYDHYTLQVTRHHSFRLFVRSFVHPPNLPYINPSVHPFIPSFIHSDLSIHSVYFSQSVSQSFFSHLISQHVESLSFFLSFFLRFLFSSFKIIPQREPVCVISWPPCWCHSEGEWDFKQALSINSLQCQLKW